MLRTNRLVSLSSILGLTVLLGARLFGQTEVVPVPVPVVDTVGEEPRRISDAERRFVGNQPRHWRQLMIRR